MRRVVVAFHAHPDDEVLLTGGTLAWLAEADCRVVVVVATDGVMGEADRGRLAELDASAAVLGVARVVWLGYADSGHGAVLYPDPPGRVRFVRAEVEEAAGRLAEVLREEEADTLLSYDPRGGNAHRDHVKVHQVGARAAELAGTRRVLEATVPREPAMRLLAVLQAMQLIRRYDAAAMFTPRAEITHRIDVRRYARRKRDALAAHRSAMAGTGRSARLFRVLVRLPVPVFGVLAGREWFVDRAAPPGGPVRDRLW